MMNAKPFVLVIHGLHMSGLHMRPLALRLRQAGFDAHTISYSSLTKPIAVHARQIHDYLCRHHDKNTPIHLVGHSLGGLVIRYFLAHYGHHWQIHRCVTLGTPHQGSICATYANRLAPPLVRKAFSNALDGSCPHPQETNVEFGVIAGVRPIGLGLPILTYHNHRHRLDADHRLHDGTVYLFETTLPYAKDYLILPTSHTGLLMNQTTAKEVIHFLTHGQFRHHKKSPL